MGEINSQTYLSYSSSFIPDRDNNNNLLSITSSKIPINDDSQFVELKSNYYYFSTESISNIVDTNFTELTITNDNKLVLPPDQIIISQSDFDYLQDTILNLEEDLISSQSYFDIEMYIARAENTSLEQTLVSVASAALDITNNLISKYEPINQSVANDLGALKYVWYIPFNDIITNKTELVNKFFSYVDVSMSNAGNIPTTLHNTVVSYSLAFDGSYLEQLFKRYEGEALTIIGLQAKIQELYTLTSSLYNTIKDLNKQIIDLQNSGSGNLTGQFGHLKIIINGQQNANLLFWNKIYLQMTTDNLPYSAYNYFNNIGKHMPNNIFNITQIQYVGETTVEFLHLVRVDRYDVKDNVIKYYDELQKYMFDIDSITSLVVRIDNVEQPQYNKNNINDLIVPIINGKETSISIVTNKNEIVT